MKLVDLLDSEFLEEHEREELKHLLKNKPERMKWLRKLLTLGPLQMFWPVAGLITFAFLFVLPALLFLGDARWWQDCIGVYLLCLVVGVILAAFTWNMGEDERKKKEEKEKEYCRFHKTYH